MKEYIERAAVETMLENAQIITDGENCGYCTEDVNLGSIPAADVAEVRSTMDWIRIDRMLPEPFVSVLCYMPKEDPFPKVHEGYVDRDGIWYVHGFRRDNGEVTHWADMPEYPE